MDNYRTKQSSGNDGARHEQRSGENENRHGKSQKDYASCARVILLIPNLSTNDKIISYIRLIVRLFLAHYHFLSSIIFFLFSIEREH